MKCYVIHKFSFLCDFLQQVSFLCIDKLQVVNIKLETIRAFYYPQKSNCYENGTENEISKWRPSQSVCIEESMGVVKPHS